MYSIYHFYKSLLDKKSFFYKTHKLEDFQFDTKLLSCINKGQFPDLAIKVNTNKSVFTGGELLELKDSDSYTVSSFNSTIPSGSKEISKVIRKEASNIKHQMELAGDDIYSLPVREVYYLVRGKNKKTSAQKIVLVHGSFFETIKIHELISQSFSQVLNERLTESKTDITPELKKNLEVMFSEQDNFSKVRNVDKASIKLRFRIMTEVKAEGNILNTTKYPEIEDNTLNFLLPYHTEQDEIDARYRMKLVFGKDANKFNFQKIKHHFNGYFLNFQMDL